MSGFEIAAIIAALITAIPSGTAAYLALRTGRKVDAVQVDVTEVKHGVETINSMTVGQQADKAELTAIEKKPESERTDLEREHVEAMKDVEL